MKLQKFFSSSPLLPQQMVLFVLLELLLIFDKTFSKFHVWGPVHLYDLLFILLTMWSIAIIIVKRKFSFQYWPILVIVGIAIVYAALSIVWFHNPTNYIIRQFALIVYLAASYIIFHSYVDEVQNTFNIKFIILIGIGSLLAQLLYHSYQIIFTEGFLAQIFDGFNYVSELAFMGLLVFEIWLLVYVKGVVRWIGLALLFLLMITLGHQGSIVLLFLLIIILYLFIKGTHRQKLAITGAGVLAIVFLFIFLPEYFADHNTMWRVIYWKQTIREIIAKNYGIIGNGFGVKYTSSEVLALMKDQINSPWFEVRPEEQYLTPMHNSFLTLAFHIGLIPMLLILLPIKNVLFYAFSSGSYAHSNTKDFLSLALLASMGWSSFHVVLELPHSSAFFWLIYFTAAYHFRDFDKTIE